MEATGHYWKNLFAVLTSVGHEVVLANPLAARRFQEANLERTKTDAIDGHGLARFGFEKTPRANPAARRSRESLRQDFEDRVPSSIAWSISALPEFCRYVRSLDNMLAEYPTALANPRRPAKLRYDGRHLIGNELAQQLVEAANQDRDNAYGFPHRPSQWLMFHFTATRTSRLCLTGRNAGLR